jgi:hypothetical protein
MSCYLYRSPGISGHILHGMVIAKENLEEDGKMDNSTETITTFFSANLTVKEAHFWARFCFYYLLNVIPEETNLN